ncbi:pyrroline-5-carboxylate reductase [Tsukamurella sp. 8F]|uniref:pyrroline-5-carboxylate reductase n=1 Tax=unclassified Tsukamurella TaxID=2633480 RepID=UPI0023B8D59E|nr:MULTISPECIES: pyrroline-5-carboxylate reductase [unclassified Tsukamurella]MDF0531709.1 pyrroline-5-carboxylate reductase [Tsukamurella sp. 8J]MDF0588955.1 pyrroline-5-carboxylate reductase [Tsukamurella sp. 8F]
MDLTLIGGGRIGEALLGGLIAAGHEPGTLTVVEHSADRGAKLAERHGVNAVTAADEGLAGADVVVVAVKPDVVDSVLPAIAAAGVPLVVSVAAGVPLRRFEAALPDGTAVVRVMPNTPMLVGKAMSGVAGGAAATEAHVATVVELMSSVGEVLVVPESKLDAVTALSGSGPAYLFLVAEAMIDAGVDLGLTRDQASLLATRTIEGAGALMVETSQSPTELRAGVTSPGGTTAAAVRELEKNGLRPAFYSATRACAERSAELGVS